MGPGSDYVLGGPIYWFMVTLLFLAGMLAAFVVLDSLRRAFFAHSSRLTARWWAYFAPQAAYLLLLLVVQGPWLPLIASAVVVLLTPLALIQSFVYLLRVVFPKADAGGAADHPGEAQSVTESVANGSDATHR